MNIIPPSPVESIVDDRGVMQQRHRSWTQLVSALSILEGDGSPEGVIEALPTRLYMDRLGTAGNILYIKRDADIGGDRTQGWILV